MHANVCVCGVQVDQDLGSVDEVQELYKQEAAKWYVCTHIHSHPSGMYVHTYTHNRAQLFPDLGAVRCVTPHTHTHTLSLSLSLSLSEPSMASLSAVLYISAASDKKGLDIRATEGYSGSAWPVFSVGSHSSTSPNFRCRTRRGSCSHRVPD